MCQSLCGKIVLHVGGCDRTCEELFNGYMKRAKTALNAAEAGFAFSTFHQKTSLARIKIVRIGVYLRLRLQTLLRFAFVADLLPSTM